MRETAQEFKVGIFVLAGFALLLGLLMNMNVLEAKSGYTVSATFNTTYGLQVGAPVQLAGVPIGSIEKIGIKRDEKRVTRVEVVARIGDDIEIDSDAVARINMQGLLGQKYLEIVPGTTGATPLKHGGSIAGRDPVDLDNIATTGGSVVRKLETSVDYINSLMGDEEFRSKLKENVTGSSELIKTLKEVSQSLEAVLSRLEKGEGTVGKLLTDETIYDDLRDLVKDIKANPWKLLKKDKKSPWPF